MEQVAHLLGVELNEKFKIKNELNEIFDDKFHFNEYGLVDECESVYPCELISLLKGRFKIVKIPFKPKQYKEYWFWNEDDGNTYKTNWYGYYNDYFRWKLGNCFRTKEEAETKGKELMESIVKEYEQ